MGRHHYYHLSKLGRGRDLVCHPRKGEQRLEKGKKKKEASGARELGREKVEMPIDSSGKAKLNII